MDFQAPIFCQEKTVGWFVSFEWNMFSQFLFWSGGCLTNFETSSNIYGYFAARNMKGTVISIQYSK